MHTPSIPPSPSLGTPGKPTWWFTGAERGQWLALVAALLGWAFDGFEMGVFPLVARPALVEMLDLSAQDRDAKDKSLSDEKRADARAEVDGPVRRWNGILSAVFLVGAALGGLVFGWIGDRFGRVRAMMFSVLAYSLFTGGCGLVTAPWQLAAFRFLAALGMGGEWSLGVALVMETWSAHARPVLAGLIGAAANFGFGVVAILAWVFKPGEHWRLILMACVFPAFLTFLLRMFVPESKQWEHAVAREKRPGIMDIFVPGLRSRALLGAAVGAIALLATWGAVQWITLWVQQSKPDLAPPAQLCSAFGAVVGAFLGAVLGRRFGRRVAYFTLCLLALAVCEYLFVGMAQTNFDVWFFIVVSLVGATTAAFYGWLALYLPELFPTRVRAAGQGFCYNFGRMLAAVGVLLTTFVFPDVGGNYSRAASIVCLVYVVGLFIAWVIPETRGQPLPE
jgi:MFS transporter, SHS family, sialic acid transporter